MCLFQKRNVFGHAGVGGQVGAADPYFKLGWGYCTNYTNPIALFSIDHRYQALQDAMQECVREQSAPTATWRWQN